MRRGVIACATVGLLVGHVGVARADDGEAYTTPVVIVDIIGDALIVSADILGSRIPDTDPADDDDVPDADRVLPVLVLGLLGIGTVVAGAPIVHFAEGEVDRGLADAGLRIVLPIAGFQATCRTLETDFWCRVGAYGGLLVAEAFDWFYLSRLDVDEPTTTPRQVVLSVRGGW